jgi:cytochrome c biogenesis protein CcdA/thiol-disulfide isomerase/thioredoxin
LLLHDAAPMILLVLVALVAGGATAITPCVLPVLPAILSASGTGGRRRPFGIVLGLAITFAVSITLLAALINGVGVKGGIARTVAIVVLILSGVVLCLPVVSSRLEAPLSRLARFGPRTRGTGFWSGLIVGAALGFVCAPCAGPILGAVISVANGSGGTTARSAAIGVAFSVGLSTVMLAWAFAGRAAVERARRALRGHVVERVMGAVLIATAVAMIFNLDTNLENSLSNSRALSAWIDPTSGLEHSHAVQKQLAAIRPASPFATRQARAAATPAAAHVGVSIPGVATPKLADLGMAPDFTRTEDWFNTPGDRPLSLASLRGHVVLVDFWTYTCINCLRTLPFLKGLYATYHRYGLDIVGVETPEFTFEQEAGNVRHAISSDGIRYPVVQDNRYGTWDAYGNEYWPAEYLIDAHGEVRHTQFGEGDYRQDEAAVRELLYEAGARKLPPPMTAQAIMPSEGLATPETYLDPKRAALAEPPAFVQLPRLGTHAYSGRVDALNRFALNGTWTANAQSITPAGASATITGRFQAQHVYLVLTSDGNRPRRVHLLIDGRPLTRNEDGADVGRDGTVTVTGQRLYSLVSLPTDEMDTLTVEVPHGVSAYDFTFG